MAEQGTERERADDPMWQLGELLKEAGATLKIGLVQQGKFDTVQRMLVDGAGLHEIGRAIGWHGPAAIIDFAYEAARRLSSPAPVTPPEQNPDPRCPTCGFTMCQQFDERPLTALASTATPNGNYRCYHCSGVGKPAPVAPPEALRALVEKWRERQAEFLRNADRMDMDDIQQNRFDARAREARTCADELSAALSAPSAGWQPIETAPKEDGLLTDGVTVSEGGWVSNVDQGADYEGQPGAPMAGWWSVAGLEKPTHWMRKPAPPAGPATEDR